MLKKIVSFLNQDISTLTQNNLPEEFTQEIPGLSIYENYQQYINIF
ncbi:hypothetical protein VKI22_01485 [Cyanobacterium aponinum UTEX 3221]|nr:hypothetical protein [Cyanobacterium aponinum]WRL38797.1 hypothetical protein VKI22_01485 [Cyanobacterium aponinum UTEX 3221]